LFPVLFRKRLEELALGGVRKEKKGFQAFVIHLS
jgi:hypothetical protein